MFDMTLRPLKDQIFNPLCSWIPPTTHPIQITFLAFLVGLGACIAAATNHPALSVALWALNRALDCLDGALARQRGEASDLGGFLDLLGDFVVYSAIPICCAMALSQDDDHVAGGSPACAVARRWLAVSVAEAAFHVNNFVLFFVAALVEKRRAESTLLESDRKGTSDAKGSKAGERQNCEVKELTSLAMRPAFIEGTESGLVFTLMLALPAWTEGLCWVLAAGVVAGTVQRVVWTVGVLSGRSK